MIDSAIGGSPEFAREMMMSARNDRVTHLMDNPLFECEIQSLRLTLIEQRNNLAILDKGAVDNNIYNIILVMLDCTDKFLKLFSGMGSPLTESPGHAVEQKMGCGTSISLISSKENTSSNGIYGSNIMENDFCGDRHEKVVKSYAGINKSPAG